jgi:hypothetical protein
MNTSPPLGRRGLGALAGSAALAGALPSVLSPAAAQQGNVRVVHAPPVPCATGPEAIVGLLLEGSGSPAGTVVVFGQAFQAGALPSGSTLAAQLANGRPVPVQADIATRHADGSARFAVVSIAAPALRAGERAGVVLRGTTPSSTAPAAPLDFVAAATGRSAMVEITPTDGGSPWQVDLLLRLQDTLIQRSAQALWQWGPLAVQARIQLPVPAAAVGGAASARLVADVALRADGTLWADVWLRNDIAMQPDGGPVAYALRLVLDGREVLKTGPVRQIQYTGFGRLRGAGRGGPAPAPPLVRHDIGYLSQIAAIAHYDLSVGVAETLLARMAQQMAQPDWSVPLSPRGLMQAMGSAGGRPDIGPTTRWQAAWLISGDRRAAEFSIGHAETGGVIPWHFWDPKGGEDGSGGWLDTWRWPGFWTDPRAGSPPRTLMQPISQDSGWRLASTHQPDLSFVPYLLTGRRAFLDGLLAQAGWSLLQQWFPDRAQFGRTPQVRDLNVIHGTELRGAAWSLRQIDNAAWIAPDGDPNRRYMLAAAQGNWAWLRSELPAWSALQGEVTGVMPGYYARGAMGPWQQDFFAYSTAMAARRGNGDARAVLQWSSNFLVGRFLAEAKGFAPRNGVTYNLAIAPQPIAGIPLGNPWDYNLRNQYRTWREIQENTVARNWQAGPNWENATGYYGALGQMSVALVIAVLDSAEARRAYEIATRLGMPATSVRDHQDDPTFNIVPPGLARVPGQAPRCT